MALSREYFCSPSYCSLDKPVPGIACVVKNYAYSISVYVQSVRMHWFLTRKSLLHFLRAGKYEKEVHILRKYIGDILIGTYEEKLQLSQLSHNRIELVERALALNALDWYWRDHLVNMNRLRSAVNVRCFGHMNPLEEYKIDGCRFFIFMLSTARRITVESLLRPWIPGEEEDDY
jgi:preprotein translocase subunit SecA